MKKLLTIFLLFVSLCVPTSARQQQTFDRGTRLIDSFGDIPLSDLKARLDNLAIELQNSPGSKGYIVAYPSPNKFPGSSLRRADSSMGYMINARGIDAQRIAVVNGGFRDATTYELWIVASGADLPVKPFDIALMMAGEKTPMLFDSFPIIERGDADEYAYEDSDEYHPDVKELYEPFVELLRRDPGLRGCVIAYAKRRNRIGYDKRLAARVKLFIAKAHAVDLSRINAFGGGRRDQKTVELWLVPPGSPLPKPTPTVRPARRKRR